MAKRNTATEISRLLPNSVEIADGSQVIRVAGNASENRTLNYLLAAQIRALLEKNVKKYSDIEQPMTPKELKELADAGRSLAEFSAEIYKGESEFDSTEKAAEAIPAVMTDFSKINEQKNDDGSGKAGS